MIAPRTRPGWVLLLALLGVLLGLAGAAVAAAPVEPVLVIGLDGLERRVVEAMWAEGYLPNLKALSERGVLLDLATAERSRERPVWTTVATGRPSAEHGIAVDNLRTSGKASVGMGSAERRVRALWNIAHEHGLTSHVADWPATFPAESISGTVISGRASSTGGTESASPPKAAASLERWNRQAEAELGQLFPGSRDAAPADRLSAFTTLRSLGPDQADLTMLRLRRIDRTSHRLWKYFEPEHYPSSREPGWEYEAREFYESYVAVDAVVGQLVNAAGPRSRVVVLSAHGFKGVDETTTLKCNLAPVLEDLGYLALYAGEPEWRRTQLYVSDSSDSNPRKQVYVNLKGREPKGRVSPKDRDALIAQLTVDLAGYEYAGTQTPAFRVEPPAAGEGGDVVVAFNEVGVGTSLERNGRLLEGAMLQFSRSTGGHGMDTPGLLIAAGPGLAQGALELDASVLDLAPTVLQLLGVPISDELDGRVLLEALDPTWLATHPVRITQSYEP